MLRPIRSADNYYTGSDRAAVRHELCKAWRSSIAGAIHSVYQCTCLPKFDRQEICGGHVDGATLNTIRVASTSEDLVAPEVESGLIRFATKEVEIVLTHEVLGQV